MTDTETGTNCHICDRCGKTTTAVYCEPCRCVVAEIMGHSDRLRQELERIGEIDCD